MIKNSNIILTWLEPIYSVGEDEGVSVTVRLLPDHERLRIGHFGDVRSARTRWVISAQHTRATCYRPEAVAGHALVHAEIVRLRTEHREGVAAVLRFGCPDAPAVREMLVVTVPGDSGWRVTQQVDGERTAVTHVVGFVVNLLLEHGRETWDKKKCM